MDYFEKLEKNPYTDLKWNIPERKQGSVNIIGGNSGHFRTEIKTAEYMSATYPLENVNVVMPEALKTKLPPLESFRFLPATDSGGFNESQELLNVVNAANFNLILGDLSRNSVTGRAVASACQFAEKMTLITRDSVDLIAENISDRLLMNENLMFLASIPQLSKLLRAAYYPKMLLLSQSLVQVAEVLHKFTLSYPVTIITLHNGQIVVAHSGVVKAISLEQASYSPIMLWSGELAAKIVALNLYNPGDYIGATCCAIFE